MDNLLSPDPASREAQPGDVLILWLPAVLMAGMGLYFALPREPATPLLIALFGGAALIAYVARQWRETQIWRWGAAFLLSVTLGLVLAQGRTFYLNTPLLIENLWNVEVSGTIQSAERAGAGWRVVLTDAVIDHHDTPTYTLRLTVRQKGNQFAIGGTLVVRASLMAPRAPFIPGMFDFQRHAYFDGISGYGYATRVLSYTPPQQQPSYSALEHYREWLSAKVYETLRQPEAGIVTALLNGQRAGISRPTTNLLQISGLQHIISISGLHVGLMAGVVFYIVRLLLACSMTLALRWPIKKIAAIAALIAIVFYMFIVGLSPPTVRSVIMTGIVLLAILVDREAINLRLVAIAALLILVAQPESVLDIGFQLSFAAVVGLVAFFQATRDFWKHSVWQSSFVLKGLRVLLLSIVTSLIATLATAPLTLAHFQKIPVLSMLSNVLATPLVAFLIMPGTFLAYLLTPFAVLAQWPIKMMGWGVTGLLQISEVVARMPAALWQTAAPPFFVVTLMMVVTYFIIIAKGRQRWWGLVPLVIAVAGFMRAIPPDLMLTQDRVLLIADRPNNTLYSEGRMDRFQKTLLLQHLNLDKVEPLSCEGDVCDKMIAQHKVRIVRTVPGLEQACPGAPEILVTRYYLDRACPGVRVLDRHALDKNGGAALWLGGEVRLKTVRSSNTNRPWQVSRISTPVAYNRVTKE